MGNDRLAVVGRSLERWVSKLNLESSQAVC